MKTRTLLPEFLLRRDALAYLPMIVMGPVVGLLSAVIYTRLLSPGIYGAFILAMGSLNIAAMVSGGWLEIAPMQFFREAQQRKQENIFLSSILHLLGYSLLGGSILYLALLTLIGKLSFALVGLLLLSTLLVCKGLMAMLRARLQTASYVWINCLGGIAGLGMAAGFYLLTRKPETIFLGAALAGCIQIGLAGMTQRDIISKKIMFNRPSPVIVREVLRFSLAIPVIGIASHVLQLGDRFMLAFFHGDAAAGLYAANYSLAEKAIGLVFAPLMMAVYPLTVAHWTRGKDREAVASLLRESGRLYVIGGGVALVLLWKFSAPLSEWLLSAKFRENHVVIPWVAAGVFFWGFAQLYHQGLYLEKRTATLVAMLAIPVVINFALNLALIPRYGARGAAWATAASYLLYMLIAREITRRLVGIRWDPPWATLLRCAGGAAGTALFITDVLGPLRVHFIVSAMTAALGYVLIISLFGEPLLQHGLRMLNVRVSDERPLGLTND
jgi:O-antigen/teichoic acid export membrane protein